MQNIHLRKHTSREKMTTGLTQTTSPSSLHTKVDTSYSLLEIHSYCNYMNIYV